MGDSDISIVSKIIIFLSSLSFIDLLLPTAFQFISILGLTVFGLSTAGVAGFCVVATGIPCAIALGVSVGLNFAVSSGILNQFGFSMVANSYQWIGALILTPISVILSIFISKLARGN